MARIRTIKPEFWTDRRTGTLTDNATKVFIGLLSHCDDYGVIPYDPLELKARIYPYSVRSPEEVIDVALKIELITSGLVQLFAHSPDDDTDPVEYLFISKFSRHQRVDKPGKPLLPGWTKFTTPDTYERTSSVPDKIPSMQNLVEVIHKLPALQDLAALRKSPEYNNSKSPPGAFQEGSNTILPGSGSGSGMEGKGKDLDLPARQDFASKESRPPDTHNRQDQGIAESRPASGRSDPQPVKIAQAANLASEGRCPDPGCKRRGTTKVAGKWYCQTHNPENLPAGHAFDHAILSDAEKFLR